MADQLTWRFKNEVGNRYRRLTVLRFDEMRKGHRFLLADVAVGEKGLSEEQIFAAATRRVADVPVASLGRIGAGRWLGRFSAAAAYGERPILPLGTPGG